MTFKQKKWQDIIDEVSDFNAQNTTEAVDQYEYECQLEADLGNAYWDGKIGELSELDAYNFYKIRRHMFILEINALTLRVKLEGLKLKLNDIEKLLES